MENSQNGEHGDYVIIANENEQAIGDDDYIVISKESKLLAASMNGEPVGMSPSPFGECCSIYKVHEKFRQANEDAYTPKIVAVGLFHHHKTALHAMDYLKSQYMVALLDRVGNREVKLEECIESIRQLEERARNSYSEPIDLDKEELIKVLVRDGLFIIELLRKTDAKEPILSNKWAMSSLIHDIVLLENQIPMSVLEKLFDITIKNQVGKSLNELAVRFFDRLMPRDEEIVRTCFNREGKNLLDLLSKTFNDSSMEMSSISGLKLKHVPCLTKLLKAGIKVKRGNAAGSFLDVKFANGVLEIPPILIQDQTETLLRNLIASEQFCDGNATSITSYAFLMDSLIDSADDVRLLRSYDIITNCLGDDYRVSSLFTELCSEVTPIDFYYSDLCDQLNAFYRKGWNVQYGAMVRAYYQNSWKVTAVVAGVAGIIPLVLPLAGTIFSVLSFAVHKS